MSITSVYFLYAAVSLWETYLFLMQRASVILSRANNINPKVGRHMLPLWYAITWPTKLVRWLLLFFVWSESGWIAVGIAWAIPFALSILIPVPFRHFLKMFHVKVERDVAQSFTGNVDTEQRKYALKLLTIITSTENQLGVQ